MTYRYALVAGIALACLSLTAPLRTLAAQQPQDEALLRQMLRFSSLAEFMGDTSAASLVRPGARRDTAGIHAMSRRLAAAAAERARAGDHAGAARRHRAMAQLEPFMHDGTSNDVPGQLRLANAIASHLRSAAHAYAAAGDSIRQVRALVDIAVLTYDPSPALDALALIGPASTADRIRLMLVVEEQLRLDDSHATADSLMVTICTQVCGTITETESGLVEAIRQEAEIARTRRGPVSTAVRSLLVLRHRIAGVSGLFLQRTLLGAYQPSVALEADARQTVRAAADSLRQGGNPGGAAHLLAAHAFTLLRGEHYAGVAASAMHALEDAKAALQMYPAGDRQSRAYAVSLVAVAHAHLAQPDSARARIAEAERLAQSAPPPARGYVRRRGALIAAMARDSVRAEQLANDAAAIVGDTGILAGVHRFRTARMLNSMKLGTASLRLAAAAYTVLRGKLGDEAEVDLLLTMAGAHQLNGNPDSAQHYLDLGARHLSAARDDLEAAHVLAAMSEGALNHGDLAGARALLDSAVVATRRAHDHDPHLHARILNDEALLLIASGRPGAALPLVRLAMGAAGPANSEYWEAARNGALALALLDSASGRLDTSGMIALYGPTAAERENRLFDLGASSDDFVRGPTNDRLVPSRAPVRPLGEGLLRMLLAEAALRKGDLSEAYLEQQQAFALLPAARHPDFLQSAHGLAGMLFVQIGRRDSALVHLRGAGPNGPPGLLEALESNAVVDPIQTGGAMLREEVLRAENRSVDARLAGALQASRRLGNKLFEARVLEAMALHYHRARRPANLARATAYYDSAVTALRETPGNNLLDWHRIQIAEQFQRLQGEATLAWLARAEELGARPAAAGAIAASDRLRGQAFAALSEGRGARPGGLVKLVLDPYQGGRPLPEVGEALLSPLGLYGPPPATLSYVQAGDTLVAFLTVPGGNEVASIRVSRRAITPDSLASVITGFRGAIGADDAATRTITMLDTAASAAARRRGLGVNVNAAGPFDEIARALADLLLPSGIDSITAPLVIVPAGPVASVPFAALPSKAGEPLGERLAIAYATTLAGHTMSSGRAPLDTVARRAWLATAVVLGNPTMPVVATRAGGPGVRLDSLPGAELEARSVAAMASVQPLIGGAATYAALRERSAGASIVHLATHGFAYSTEERVGDSFIALAPGPADDGIVTVNELLADSTLKLDKAALVVLSACQTGLGQTTGSEGTLGLQRAILATGATNVLVSLWSVSDEATALLLKSFYEHWLQDTDHPPKSEALRRAQQDVRETGRFAHPRYWAAFQLAGAEY